ncbi:aquaporin-11 [Scophthalmus maximus]|nr:aquaporin-11 [Scophthalmus maximus]
MPHPPGKSPRNRTELRLPFTRGRDSGRERGQRPERRQQQLNDRTVPDRQHTHPPEEMTADVAVSLLMLAGIVGLSDATRRLLSSGTLAGTGLSVCAVELVSTFQLCCCTHELKLLSDVGGIEPRLALTLTYLASVVHGLTFGGAIGNPSGTLEHAYRSRITGRCALRRIACQFAAAAAARAAVPVIWGLGLSRLHVRHKLLGYRCVSAIHAALPRAAAVEFACAFAVQTAITHTRSVEEKYRVHAVAAVIASVVYAGGSMTGAVFNPALAFSTQFPCSGPSFLEYCLVYWLGPLLGMMSSVLLFDKLVPRLSRTSSSPHLSLETKKRT